MSFARRFVSILAVVVLVPAFAQTPQKPPSQNQQAQQQQKPKCSDNGTYTNTQGNTVKRPENCSAAPAGSDCPMPRR